MTYPIQIVVRETGLTSHVLRAWEKRYGAVIPSRTPTGRRMYSEQDVRRLKLLRQATLLGHPIASVAKLSIEGLERTLRTAAEWARADGAATEGRAAARKWETIVGDCIEAAKAFDADSLNKLLQKVVLEFGYNALLRQVVSPLAQRMGNLWNEGAIRISHEHFATGLIRAFLLNPSRQYSGSIPVVSLVAATPQGQLHELGAVMAAALAAEQGWRVIYLGPSLPAAEIATVAIQNEARAVALSVVYPEADPNVERELLQLREFLPRAIRILIGGRGARSYQAAINGLGAEIIEDFGALQVALAKIRASRS